MEWVWKQSTGELFLRGSPVTTPFATGYAGYGEGRNNPDMQCVQDIGPIPRGGYTMGLAPLSLPLTPPTRCAAALPSSSTATAGASQAKPPTGASSSPSAQSARRFVTAASPI